MPFPSHTQLLPQVGGANARKTNKDYTKGKLHELIDIIIEEKMTLMDRIALMEVTWALETTLARLQFSVLSDHVLKKMRARSLAGHLDRL